jgi:membrane protein DedA with SNARE-associated domain
VTARLASSAWLVSAAATVAVAAGKPQLPSFLSAVAGPIDHYGLWAVGLLVLLENIGLPVIPGELALIAGAIYAGAGQLNVVAVGVTAAIAAFAGSMIGFAIGRFGGRALVLRYGRYVFVREHHLDRAERTVSRFGGLFVLVARYIIGLRELNGIICGVTGMRPVTFTTFNAIGAVAWVGTWVSIGYFAGDNIAAIYADVTKYFVYVIIAAVVVVAAWIAYRLRGRAARRRDHAADQGADHGADQGQGPGQDRAQDPGQDPGIS